MKVYNLLSLLTETGYDSNRCLTNDLRLIDNFLWGGSIAMRTRQIVIDIPEGVLLAEKTDEQSFAREIRLLAAVKLYEMGRLSSGRAAELAGMSRVEFLLALGRYQVFPLNSELQELEKSHG
jgi:predicted HTH domain antitoxin